MKSKYIINKPLILNLEKYKSYHTKYQHTLNHIITSEIIEKLESNTLELNHIYHDIKPQNWTNIKNSKLIKRLYILANTLYAKIGYAFPLTNLYIQRSLVDIEITDRPTRMPSGEPSDQVKEFETALYFLAEAGQLLITRQSYTKNGQIYFFCKPSSRTLADDSKLFKKTRNVIELQKRASARSKRVAK